VRYRNVIILRLRKSWHSYQPLNAPILDGDSIG
jgi:hypothetical protein